MKLTIAIVTMNRSKQLLEALESCVACELPIDTQFVIIDNASADQTESVVKTFFANNPFHIYYEKMQGNIGAGKGRNVAFQHVKSEYVYFMDDDAYIDNQHNDFFMEAIRILDDNPNVITLTTQIYDLAWKKNRVEKRGPVINEELWNCYMVCGGSHFLRCAFFIGQNPYFENKYGYEELQPSLRVADANKINAFAPNLLAIHNPVVNKWNFADKRNDDVLIGEIANQKAIKGRVYSIWAYPIVCFAYYMRCRKHLDGEQKKKADRVVSELSLNYNFGSRIKLWTVIQLCKNFGIGIF